MRSAMIAFAVAVALGAPSVAHAEFGIAPDSFTARMIDAAGNPEVRAGAHPDRFQLELAFEGAGGVVEDNVKDIELELPRGFVGNPNAVAACSRDLIAVVTSSECPPESMIGALEFRVGLGVGRVATLTAPIYSMDPLGGTLAEFGFRAFVFSGHLTAHASPDGRHLTIRMGNVIQDTPLQSVSIELWGVPADRQTGTVTARRALLTAPTRCDGGPPVVTARVRSWQEPGVWRTDAAETGPALVGCDSLEFDPRLDFALDAGAADTPTGAHVSLALPQDDDPDGQDTARVKDIAFRLPDGVALSPSAANGLTACPEQAVGLGQPGAANCPASSKIGTVELSSPLLDAPISGAIHMGGQLSGTDYRLFVLAGGPGVDFKFQGSLHADPETGQLSTTLSDLPELPVDRFTLSFSGGSRAPLVTPLACGTGTASATLTPYSGGPPVTTSDVVAIATDPAGRPCPPSLPFAPTFVAGTSPARAGVAGPLTVTILRADGEQLLDRFTMTLPPGLSSRLASVERCPAARAVAGACPPAARIGSAITETGSGDSPFALEGDVFLTDSHRRAPFGLALVFRAVAGPFDLGTIVMRAALRIDSRTGQVTVESDPLPRVVKGIPLRIRTVALDIDRPGFIVNPTSCAPTAIASTLRSAGGVVVRPSSRFAVGACRSLRFRPAISMALTDRSELREGGHPGLRMRMRMGPHNANLRELDLRLPSLLRPAVLGPTVICSLEQARDGRCPAEAKVGSATGRTPMLSGPLRGSLYMVQPPGNGPPDVWAVMRGMGVSLSIRMKAAVRGGRLRGTLVDVPDMPLSRFTMRFAGGEHGMFAATRSPCVGRRDTRRRAARMLASARLTAHSGATRSLRTRVGVASGCPSKRPR